MAASGSPNVMDKSGEESEFDLLDDIFITKAKEEEAKKQKESIDLASMQSEEFLALKKRCTDLEEDNAQLQKNIGLLWKTAKVQLTMKEKELAKQKQEKEALIFRRAMRTIPKDELERVVTRIVAYHPDEFERFLSAISQKQCDCTQTKNVKQKATKFTKTLEQIKESIMGKRVQTQDNLVTVGHKVSLNEKNTPYKEIPLNNNLKKKGPPSRIPDKKNRKPLPPKAHSNEDARTVSTRETCEDKKSTEDRIHVKKPLLGNQLPRIDQKENTDSARISDRAPNNKRRLEDCRNDHPSKRRKKNEVKTPPMEEKSGSVVLKDCNATQKEPVGNFSDKVTENSRSHRRISTTNQQNEDRRKRDLVQKENEALDERSRKSRRKEPTPVRSGDRRKSDKLDLRDRIRRNNIGSTYCYWGQESRNMSRKSPERCKRSRSRTRRERRSRSHRRTHDGRRSRSPHRRKSMRSPRRSPRKSQKSSRERKEEHFNATDKWGVFKEGNPKSFAGKTNVPNAPEKEEGEIDSSNDGSTNLPRSMARDTNTSSKKRNGSHTLNRCKVGERQPVESDSRPNELERSKQNLSDVQPMSSTRNTSAAQKHISNSHLTFTEEDTIDRVVRENNERQEPIELCSDDSEMSLLLYLDSPRVRSPKGEEKAVPKQDNSFSELFKKPELLSPIVTNCTSQFSRPPQASPNVQQISSKPYPSTPTVLSEPNCSPITPATPINAHGGTPNLLSKTSCFGEQKSSTPIVASFNLDEKMKRSNGKSVSLPVCAAPPKTKPSVATRSSLPGKKKVPFITLSTSVLGDYVESDNSMESAISCFSRQGCSSSSISHSFVQRKQEALLQTESIHSQNSSSSSSTSSSSSCSSSSSSSSSSDGHPSQTISSGCQSTPPKKLSFHSPLREARRVSPVKGSVTTPNSKKFPSNPLRSPRFAAASGSSNSADSSSLKRDHQTRTISSVNLEGASGNTILSSIDAEGGFLSESRMAALNGEVEKAAITSFGSQELNGLRESLRKLDPSVLPQIEEASKSPKKPKTPSKPTRKSARLSAQISPIKELTVNKNGKELQPESLCNSPRTLEPHREIDSACPVLHSQEPDNRGSPITVATADSTSSSNIFHIKTEPSEEPTLKTCQKVRVKIRKKPSFRSPLRAQFQSSPVSVLSAGPNQEPNECLAKEHRSSATFQLSDVDYV